MEQPKQLSGLPGCVGCVRACQWNGPVAGPDPNRSKVLYKCNNLHQWVAEYVKIRDERRHP
jgi:hypothetical protein